MFQVGDLIVHGSEGVCRVEDVGSPPVGSICPNRIYYTLKPLYRSGRSYTPVDTVIQMRPVITSEQAQQLIRQMLSVEVEMLDDCNLRMQTEYYRSALQTNECEKLVQLIRTAYTRQQTAISNKRKPSMNDERYLKRAEDLLYGELAVALDIPKDEVKSYILTHSEQPDVAPPCDCEAVS